MKTTNLTKELSALDKNRLELRVEDWRKQLLSLHLNAATTHIKNYSQFKKLRGNIARGLTLLQIKAEQTVNQKKQIHG